MLSRVKGACLIQEGANKQDESYGAGGDVLELKTVDDLLRALPGPVQDLCGQGRQARQKAVLLDDAHRQGLVETQLVGARDGQAHQLPAPVALRVAGYRSVKPGAEGGRPWATSVRALSQI